MTKAFYFAALLAVVFSCGDKSQNTKESLSVNPPASVQVAAVDTTPRVVGIGGIFFGSENPKEVRKWYGDHLGLAINEYGSPFEFRNANHPEQVNYLQWAPFKTGNEYFLPSKKEFMINYRVNNLEGLLRKLKAEGVTIVDSIDTYEYGKFLHIMDLEGNKIELWEPVDSVLSKIGSKTTK